MNDEKELLAETILASDTVDLMVEELNSVNDSELLHLVLMQYDWDDGYEVLEAIMNNPFCELSTALEMFYLAEGEYYCWMDKNDPDYAYYAKDSEDRTFVKKLYSGIMEGKYKRGCIEFTPPLTKVQLYKLKKQLNDDELVFVEPIVNK